MSLETRLRNTGQQPGGGGSSNSAGLAGKDAVYVLSSFNAEYTNAVYIKPGSSVTTHITGSNLFINAVTSAAAGNTAGLGFFPMLPQQAKLYANTSSARIDAGTPIWRLIYKQDTQQYGIWQFLIPIDYSSNPYVRILWGVDSGMAVGKTTTWIIEQWGWSPFLANSSMYVDTYGGANSVTMGISAGYSSGTLQMLTIPIANAVSIGLYNLIKVRISNSGNWVGNVEYVGGNFEYTRA